MDKAPLRSQLLARRRALSLTDRQACGRALAARLFAWDAWQTARTIGCYLSLPDEMPTQEIVQTALAAGKRVAAPVTHLDSQSLTFHAFHGPDELRAGPLGILQPGGHGIALDQIDLLLVPGVGFDPQGNRLGYGGGFFDRVLDRYSGMSCGLAFELQIVGALPTAGHDRPVRRVLTELRFYPDPPSA